MFLHFLGDTPARFVSQLFVLLRPSDGLKRRRECEAARRAEPGAGEVGEERGRRPSQDIGCGGCLLIKCKLIKYTKRNKTDFFLTCYIIADVILLYCWFEIYVNFVL